MAYALVLFIFPSDLIVGALGAQGYVAGIGAIALLLVWSYWVVFQGHDPLSARHPTRAVLLFLVFASSLSYAFVPFHDSTSVERLSADRWLMLLAGSAGVCLCVAELVGSLDDLVKVLTAVVLGGSFSGVVAALQWTVGWDVATWIRQSLPGFEINPGYSTYQARGALERVTGTALHPIELGVVGGMLLPIAIALAMSREHAGPLRRWLPVGLVGLALPASISRSAILAAVISLGVFLVMVPTRRRFGALLGVPIAALALLVVRPGYVTTLSSVVAEARSDPSIAARLVDYGLVERLYLQHPLFGAGGGTYIADNAFDILDNQYLKSSIELGGLGLVAVACWFAVPAIAAVMARRRSRDPRLRLVAAALSGSGTAAAVCSATFDSLSFNMFAGLYALLVGAIGCCWILAGREAARATSD